MEYIKKEIKIQRDNIKSYLEKHIQSQDINEIEKYNKEISKENQFIESLINSEKYLDNNNSNHSEQKIESKENKISMNIKMKIICMK